MSTTKLPEAFEPKTWKDAPLQAHDAFQWAITYNSCLEATGARELWEALNGAREKIAAFSAAEAARWTHDLDRINEHILQQFIDIIDELLKLQDIYTRSMTGGVVAKEERNYLKLQWGAIWSEVRRRRAELALLDKSNPSNTVG